MLVFAYFSASLSGCSALLRLLRKKIEAKVAGMTDKKLNDFYLERLQPSTTERAELRACRSSIALPPAPQALAICVHEFAVVEYPTCSYSG